MSHTVKVMEVQNVDLTIYKMLPPTLNIHADGVVPTLGYKNGRLVPYVYVQFPPDGIWDFDFVAEAPDGPAGDILCPISADYVWHDYPKKLEGVRIHAAINFLEKKIGKYTEKTVELRTSKK